MSYYKKSIVLSNKLKGVTYGLGVLVIEKNNSGVYGNFVCHDCVDSGLILGIAVNGKEAEKFDVVLDKNKTFNFRLNADLDIDGDIGAVLVRIENGDVLPIMWGANANKADIREDIINQINALRNIATEQTVENTSDSVETLKQHLNLFSEDDNMESLIESEVDKALDEVDKDFYELIKPQLEELFTANTRDETLEAIIPNSEWIKVDYDGEGREYIVGKIYDDNKLKYICYGVPGVAGVAPPDRLLKYSQWLPLSNQDQSGYWIMYQDALTGDAQEVG